MGRREGTGVWGMGGGGMGGGTEPLEKTGGSKFHMV